MIRVNVVYLLAHGLLWDRFDKTPRGSSNTFFFYFFYLKAPKHTLPPQTPTRTALVSFRDARARTAYFYHLFRIFFACPPCPSMMVIERRKVAEIDVRLGLGLSLVSKIACACACVRVCRARMCSPHKFNLLSYYIIYV